MEQPARLTSFRQETAECMLDDPHPKLSLDLIRLHLVVHQTISYDIKPAKK
jgi:hypothetical protein